MAFSTLHDEYWAADLESLGLDTLSNTETIVSQPSKCLKFMTFLEGCFVIRN